MVKHSCHIHLTGTIRQVVKPPHNMVQVSPAGAGETCDICQKTAIWAVNPIE